MSTFIVPPHQHVPFLGVRDACNLVNQYGIEAFLSDLAGEIVNDFIHWERLDKSPRYASHSQDGVIELMPVSDGSFFSCKTVNGHPNNYRKGFQTVTAFGFLNDVETGYPVLLSEMCILTALRTAATSAVVAKSLAPVGANHMALIGNGAQAEFQALAFRALLGIERISLFDVDRQASVKTYDNLIARGFEVSISDSIQAALAGAQIITTCTADKRNAQILSNSMVGDGVHLNAIGGDCPGKTELDPAILQRASVFVEYAPQTRVEGEIQLMPADFRVTELHELFSGSHPGRRNANEITIFDSVGFASEDLSVLRFIRNILAEQRSEATGDLQTLDMVSSQKDPKNLFSLLARQTSDTLVGNT